MALALRRRKTEAVAVVPAVDPVAEAKAAVDSRLSEELRWSEAWRERKASIADIEARAGAALLDAEDAGEALRQQGSAVAQARAEMDAAYTAIVEARCRREAAIRGIYAAQGAEKRAEAARLREEADNLDERAAPHLAALLEVQGVAYAPDQSQVQTPAGGVGLIVSPISRATGNRMTAERLEREATALESRAVIKQGRVEAQGIEALVSLVTADAMVVAPPLPRIWEWAGALVAAVEARRARIGPQYSNHIAPGTPVDLVFAWRDGEIDVARSGAPELERRHGWE